MRSYLYFCISEANIQKNIHFIHPLLHIYSLFTVNPYLYILYNYHQTLVLSFFGCTFPYSLTLLSSANVYILVTLLKMLNCISPNKKNKNKNFGGWWLPAVSHTLPPGVPLKFSQISNKYIKTQISILYTSYMIYDFHPHPRRNVHHLPASKKLRRLKKFSVTSKAIPLNKPFNFLL